MLSWQSFLEKKVKCDKALEKAEEETGVDWDKDNEKGESKKHKDKILAARKKNGLGNEKGNTKDDVEKEKSQEEEQERE